MDPATAFRAIIRLVAGDLAGYETIISTTDSLVDVRYYYSKNKYVNAKLDIKTGDLHIGNIVRRWAKVG